MRLTGLRVLVAGAGVVGSAVALTLRRQGATVVLADPDPPEGNASLVAAGMLAPALEAVLDPGASEHFPLFKAARDIWPDFAAGMADDDGLDRSGSLWVGSEQSQAEIRDRLLALGAAVEVVSAVTAEAMAEGLKAGQGAVYTPEDWRVDPRTMRPGPAPAFAARRSMSVLRRAAASPAPRWSPASSIAMWTPGPSRGCKPRRRRSSRRWRL